MASAKFPESSNVTSADYNRRKRQLVLTFKGNRPYMYSDVPYSKYRKLINSASKGSFVNHQIAFAYKYKKLKRIREKNSS